MNDEKITQVLQTNKTVAVYGMSKNPEKPSYHVPEFLLEKGYNVIPLNPGADEILGQKCYKKLADVEGQIEILDVFRPSADIAGVVQEAVERKKARGDIKVIWVQEGITSPEGKKLAEESGFDYIEDRCMLKEHKRLIK